MNKYISASIMCADLLNMEAAVKALEKSGVDYLHVDIMDGAFVPNITLGFDLVNVLKKATDIPLDIHMMVNEPSRFIDRMSLSENDVVCVHYESEVHVHRTLEMIKNKGCKAGLAVNPQTPLCCAECLTDYIDMLLVMTVSPGFAGQKLFAGAERKVEQAKALLDSTGNGNILIEVDGNISVQNGAKLSKKGADVFVLGTSSLFLKDKSLEEAAKDFRAVL